MRSLPPRIEVAAGILVDRAGCVLLAERRHDRAFAGLWEFPGGKLAAGESAEQALCRELAEELGIEVMACAPYTELKHDYADRRVHLTFFLVEEWRHDIRPLEGQRLRWLRPADIDETEILAADRPVIEALRARFG